MSEVVEIKREKSAHLKGLQRYIANTSAVVNWDELRKVLATAPPALTENEYCELLLDIANGAVLSIEQWNQFVGISLFTAPDQEAVALHAYFQESLVTSLRVLIEGSRKEKVELTRLFATEASNSVVIVPYVSPNDARKERVIATGLPGAINYARWLIVDPQREFAQKLCRCQYSDCGKFFFQRSAKGGVGAPSRTYCSADHMKKGRREKSRELMKKARSKRK